MEIGLIFSTAKIALSIAALTGIIDSVDAKIDRLSQADLSAALRSLEQASISEQEKDSLLREARSSFNRAIGLEKNFRKAVAYLGLSLVHYHLKDNTNHQQALEKLLLEAPNVSVTQLGVAEALVCRVNHRIFVSNQVLCLLSKNRRVQHRKRIMETVVEDSDDIRGFVEIQLAVSTYIRKPVKWMIDMENGNF
ncbi:MAG: hypothetical protein F6K23_10365 [Okeania sp. SIO2C9]|uniref:hypothetical protein n=1 Tax=Okeania sp. SIO2C9 TaxID=2607791 RepID=UPI0013C0CD95|nr:hypothetical protein [Okeania sp. SIO2C9]NEQ73436.1 hypothetical protein [Okeania sp. SIO2C9]